ncbi:MAG: hypothetical protein MUF72_23450, partial [Elainella sp. Prado103]|nr:hypothetical protein [Elainella sp. Prado103]
MKSHPKKQIQIAIAWCLAYTPDQPHQEIQRTLRHAFNEHEPCTGELGKIVAAVRELGELSYPKTVQELQSVIATYPLLWQKKIGLVYGGATKIKPYVFDALKLHEIRGASALLDNVNLVDLPAFFHADRSSEVRFEACRNAGNYCDSVRQWLSDHGYAALHEALIHELIVYSTGGNILAFCPPDVVIPLANAIEQRYTHETLTANSCAVGKTFKPLELQFGLLPDPIPDDFPWLEDYQQHSDHELVQAYLKIKSDTPPQEIETQFQNRKSFNELTSQLAILFNQRRAGNDTPDRASRRYPIMFETHPYLHRDNTEKRSAVLQANGLPNDPWYSEPTARKRLMGQITKRDDASRNWYREL